MGQDMHHDTGVTTSVAAPDGRTLTCFEVGDPQGPLVIHNHGGPSSRYEARLFADSASKNRLRLLCVDRPGIGQSSPQKTRTYSGWADDLVTIADALGYHEFGVTGWSEGGPWLMYATLAITTKHFRGTFFKQLLKAVNDYDRQILVRPDFETNFCETCAECFAHGSDGLVRDSQLLYRSWAFDVASIERRVHMWQGLDDRLVAESINKTVAD